jgi:hypothetical protein
LIEHFPSRLRMPFGRLERGQQIVELARLGVEIDLGGQLLDHLVELVGVLSTNWLA